MQEDKTTRTVNWQFNVGANSNVEYDRIFSRGDTASASALKKDEPFTNSFDIINILTKTYFIYSIHTSKQTTQFSFCLDHFPTDKLWKTAHVHVSRSSPSPWVHWNSPGLSLLIFMRMMYSTAQMGKTKWVSEKLQNQGWRYWLEANGRKEKWTQRQAVEMHRAFVLRAPDFPLHLLANVRLMSFERVCPYHPAAVKLWPPRYFCPRLDHTGIFMLRYVWRSTQLTAAGVQLNTETLVHLEG